MPERRLRDLDLNLLHALRALLEEKHVTRAARRCFLSQPAMSRVLERLRDGFGDALLVRSGRSYERTVRGARLLVELESVMPRIEAMVRGEAFDPATSEERFRVSMTDHGSLVLMPGLVERIRRLAPRAGVDALSWTDRIYEDVAAGRVDAAFSAEPPPPALDSEILYEDDSVCVIARRGHRGKRSFALAEYVDLPHVVVETWARYQSAIDWPLAQLGLKRNMILRVPFFVPTLLTVARTDLVLTVPRRLARIMEGTADLRVVEAPPEIKGLPYFMAWPRRLAAEPAHVWFRDLIRAVVRSLPNGPDASTARRR